MTLYSFFIFIQSAHSYIKSVGALLAQRPTIRQQCVLLIMYYMLLNYTYLIFSFYNDNGCCYASKGFRCKGL